MIWIIIKTLVSKNLKMVSLFVGKKEPKEIIIPLLKLSPTDKKLDREQKIIYWLAWLIEYEKSTIIKIYW